MQLRLSRLAQGDLADIRDHTLENHGAAQAAAYLEGIEVLFRRLVDHPSIGAENSDIRPDVRSLPFQRHRIYYRVDGESIVVIRVLHQSMDAGRWIGG